MFDHLCNNIINITNSYTLYLLYCVRYEHAKETSSSFPSLSGAEDYEGDFHRVAEWSATASTSKENARRAHHEKVFYL